MLGKYRTCGNMGKSMNEVWKNMEKYVSKVFLLFLMGKSILHTRTTRQNAKAGAKVLRTQLNGCVNLFHEQNYARS